jgi:RNA recognition motif-containing protein
MEAFPLEAEQHGDSNNLENTAKEAGNEAGQNPEDPPQDGQQNSGSPAAKREGSFNGSANGDQKSGEQAGDRGRSGSFDRRSRSASNGRRRSNERGENFNDNRDANPETFTQIYIAGIKRETGEDDLRGAFEKFGEIESVTVRDHYAFVKYIENKSAAEAIAAMDGQPFVNGEILKVQQSRMYKL